MPQEKHTGGITATFTQKLIIETFKNMLERMPLEKITVTALIKECNIGRNTFYYHYENTYALLKAPGANALKIRPCIEVHDGLMRPGKKYRGQAAVPF